MDPKERGDLIRTARGGKKNKVLEEPLALIFGRKRRGGPSTGKKPKILKHQKKNLLTAA